MKVYAVRKRHGQWAICSDEDVLLQFENYDEAVQTARSAVEVLFDRDRMRASIRGATFSLNGASQWRIEINSDFGSER